LDATIMDLRAPLDLTIDPVKAAGALERTRIALLGMAVDIKDTRHHMDSMLHKYNTAQGFTPTGEACGPQCDRSPLPRARVGLRRNKCHRPTKARESIAGATALRARAVEITAPGGLATMAGAIVIRLS
jgi:hypothetical protein